MFDVFGYDERREDPQALERRKEIEAITADIRVKNEDIIKRRDMKDFLFGDFVSAVPLVKIDRFLDDPLAYSCAEPFDVRAEGRKVNYTEESPLF